jgi:hypothetical protein
MIPPRHVVLICEDGWEGIRKFALLLSENKIPVSVIIKGDPGKEVKEMISSKLGIQNYFFKRNSYRLFLYPLLGWLSLRRRWDVCCITKERTYKELKVLQRIFRFSLYHFLESGSNSLLQDCHGGKTSVNDYLQLT